MRRCERPDPAPLPQQILVRVKAASLNFRDLLIAKGPLHERHRGHRYPTPDREFDFDDATAAYRHLESRAHFGKVVVRW